MQQQQSQARGGYQFGDITKNIVSKGKESDGRSKNDGYKFGKCSWIDHFVPTFSFLMLLCKFSFYQAISLVVSSNRLRTGRRCYVTFLQELFETSSSFVLRIRLFRTRTRVHIIDAVSFYKI